MLAFFKRQRRRRLRAQPFPDSWREIVRTYVRFFDRLSSGDQAELLSHVQVFLAEKRFEGCAGMELTDDIRLTIAAQACLLLLHRKTDYFPRLLTILVYPSSYLAKEERPIAENIWEEGTVGRLGET